MKSFEEDFFYDGISYDDAEERIYARESLIYNVTEDLLLFLEDNEISKKELAKRLGKTAAYVTQLLNGSRNMTLGSFSDICFALGFKPKISIPVLKSESEDEIVENFDLISKYIADADWTNEWDNWSLSSDVWQKVNHVQVGHMVVHKKVRSNVIDRTDVGHWQKVA
ncbi:helix-turn-helix domain-containing protein [Shewanella sp. NKUCC05_KAH]|uniref:helix-turn-helix domain-containing protein n=1 Tax=Shewanella sp. NKUCC05_KAH TaxID=2842126 RepID=UPI001C5A5B0A|nr:helix-turn-helix domain-containing protein [Shewanella sp. NKUCC05_KAH]MBW3529130.1 helix-turn-helix domain-containing protein [Shewanella sp. NKUCC05_KAH]